MTTPMIREGFKTLLARSDDFEVAGEAENGVDLMKVVRSSETGCHFG